MIDADSETTSSLLRPFVSLHEIWGTRPEGAGSPREIAVQDQDSLRNFTHARSQTQNEAIGLKQAAAAEGAAALENRLESLNDALLVVLGHVRMCVCATYTLHA